MSIAKQVEDLVVYQTAFRLAMEIFEATKSLPREERYALTDQIRRSSRSVCANLAEGWAKRRYEAHFLSKLSDADAENAETTTWIKFANACAYFDLAKTEDLLAQNRRIGAMLGKIIKDYRSFISTGH